LPPYECLAESYWEVVKELDQLVDENDYMKRELTARGLGWVVKAAERHAGE
jgi:uncharacterized protein YacL